MALESIYADAFVYHTLQDPVILSGLGGDKVYPYHAPQGAKRPYIIYSMQAGVCINNGMIRIKSILLYWVRIIYNPPANDGIRSAADRMDDLLQSVRNGHVDVAPELTFNGWRRNQRQLFESTPEFGDFIHLGGEYILEVS